MLLLTACESGYLPPGPPRAADGPQAVAVAPTTDARIAPLLRQGLAARSLLATGTPRLLLDAGYFEGSVHVTLRSRHGLIYSADIPVQSETIFALDAPDRLRRRDEAIAQAVDDAIDTPSFRAAITQAAL